MKSEAEIMNRIDSAVCYMEQFAKDYSSIPEEQIPRERREQMNAAVLTCLLFGWVLDCEADVECLIRKFRIASAADKLGGKI